MFKRSDIALMEHLPPRGRRHDFTPDEIKELVAAIRPGLTVPANLERHARGWRLRFTFNNPAGGSIRRGISLPDEETASWVGKYLVRSRVDWLEQRRARRKARLGL
jgi:hypothetical protein